MSLDSGVGWFWSPQWLYEFAQVRVRGRKTYHPGETRTVGQAAKQIALSDVREFVGRLRTVLDRKQRPSQVHTAVPSLATAVRKGQAAEAAASSAGALPRPTPEEDRLRAENQMLRAQNADLHRQLGQVKSALDAVRKVVEPEYRAMQKLFVELDAAGAASGADAAVFEPWKARLGDGPAKMIDALLSRGGELTKHQLSTLSGYSISSSTFDAYLSRLRRNGLIETQNNLVRLRVP